MATLASKVDIPNETANVKVTNKTLRATATELILEVLIEKEDWRTPIIEKFSQPSSSAAARELKDFVLRNGELYYRGSGGVLARVISKEQGKAEMDHVHNLCCGDNDISLYRRLQRKGYYWPNMKQDAADL